ncbi:MAG TPA: hypothetical protein VMU05_22950, partial [Dongiaceae bacterium]|nr:hypothetical protein [Dongiaceae bacterium]
MRLSKLCFLLPLLFVISAVTQSTAPQAAPKPLFKFQEVMIPARDGVRLQTVILTPIDQQGP